MSANLPPVRPGGSDVDLRQLLLDGNRLLEQSPQTRMEVTVRLEVARSALVQNQPAEVLAILDESWDAAQHTEHGWYLRASALAALGLPGEAMRVAQDALRLHPNSRALQLVGSHARLLVGGTPSVVHATRVTGQNRRVVDHDAEWRSWQEVERASVHITPRSSAAIAGTAPGSVAFQTHVARLRPATGPHGWDALPSTSARSRSARMARVVAVVCVLAAIGAMAAGKAVVALALAGGASWFALRRGHRLHDTAEYQTAERSIRDASR